MVAMTVIEEEPSVIINENSPPPTKVDTLNIFLLILKKITFNQFINLKHI